MKKLLLFTFHLSLFTGAIFAYTETDVENASYLASKNIITTQSTTAGYRLDESITRAEVAGIALKLRGATLPEGYQCKKYFSDVLNHDWICRAVELSADRELVSKTNSVFRPQDKITRAEALSIIMKSVWIEAVETESTATFPFSDVTVAWQKKVVLWASGVGIIYSPNVIIENGGFFVRENATPTAFYPNRDATRAEVFAFAKKAHAYHKLMSGEVAIQ